MYAVRGWVDRCGELSFNLNKMYSSSQPSRSPSLSCISASKGKHKIDIFLRVYNTEEI